MLHAKTNNRQTEPIPNMANSKLNRFHADKSILTFLQYGHL